MVKFVVFSLLIATLILCLSFTEACFSSGVCGGSCGMPAPAPVCSGGCGQGYSCGQYGCYRVRARVASSKTLKIDEGDDDKKLLNPDQRFMACCQSRNLPDQCLNKCSYSTYSRQTLQNMYFRTDSCPMQAAADIQYCAAEGKDHRECCYRNGITTTLAGDKCLTFCDQRPGNVTKLDFSYMPCYDRFENMKQCFYQSVNKAIIDEQNAAVAEEINES
uniref:DB domain-containing protein n=1 Tax=Parastrongyloides trichosuri TaxID=131310 RepID=A0A0N4ZBI7_PARTI